MVDVITSVVLGVLLAIVLITLDLHQDLIKSESLIAIGFLDSLTVNELNDLRIGSELHDEVRPLKDALVILVESIE